MSALLLQWVRTQRLQKKPPHPPWYWREWQQWSHGILLPHTKHWVAFVCVGGRRGGSPGSLALSLSAARLWMWDASVVRRKKPQSGWFSGKRYNIYSWHSGGSWHAARGVTRSRYFKTFLSRSQLSSFCNPPFLFFFCYPRWDWCCRFCPGVSKNVRRASFRSRNHKVGVIECRFAVFG